MKIFFRFSGNSIFAILISKLSFIFSPFFLPNTPGILKTQKMVSIVARTGRQFQRYNQGCRQVVGWVSSFSLFLYFFLFSPFGGISFSGCCNFPSENGGEYEYLCFCVCVFSFKVMEDWEMGFVFHNQNFKFPNHSESVLPFDREFDF